MQTTPELLLEKAKDARNNAYAPYSQFAVGAALLAQEGTVFVGCNVENATYGATVCAERTAIYSAIAQGHRHFSALAIVGGVQGHTPRQLCLPCGICRQVLAEFCADDLPIYGEQDGAIQSYTLGELLPHAFRLTDYSKEEL